MKYAVITNDLQNGILYKHEKRTKQVSEFLPTFTHFLNEIRRINVPVLHLQLVISEDDPRAQGVDFDYPDMTTGSHGAAMIPEALGQSDIVIVKNKDSGFFKTNLDEVLKELNVDRLIVCGLQTHICVQTTAVDAYFRGYKTIIPRDGVFSPRQEDTDKALGWLEWYCSNISTMEDIVDRIENGLEFPPRPCELPKSVAEAAG